MTLLSMTLPTWTSEPEDLPPGTLVGSYEIVGPPRKGGMGAVYEAVHRVLGNRAAIKLIHLSLLSNAELVGRFYREGCAAAAIRHPHVLRVTDVGQLGERPYLVMEFLDGLNLHELLDTDE